VALVMGRYQINTQFEVSGGLRRSRWSGAYAAITKFENNQAQWNNMFNVDWTRDLGGGVYRGYPATSTDLLLGLRYRMGHWVASTGMAYLGKASTDNPTESGQRNSALVNTLGLNYEFDESLRGLQLYGFAGIVNYGLAANSSGCNGQPDRKPGTCSLAPISMPGNAAFTNVDSRVARSGNWLGVGVVYAF
jgi:long-subunit fatty acid transport protein